MVDDILSTTVFMVHHVGGRWWVCWAL